MHRAFLIRSCQSPHVIFLVLAIIHITQQDNEYSINKFVSDGGIAPTLGQTSHIKDLYIILLIRTFNSSVLWSGSWRIEVVSGRLFKNVCTYKERKKDK